MSLKDEQALQKLLDGARLESDWDDYAGSMGVDGWPLPLQLACKRAYYAGAWTGLMDAVLVVDASGVATPALERYLDGRVQEAVAHAQLVKAGLA